MLNVAINALTGPMWLSYEQSNKHYLSVLSNKQLQLKYFMLEVVL